MATLLWWGGLVVGVIINAFYLTLTLGFSGAVSSPSCTGQADACAELQREVDILSNLLLGSVVVAPVLALAGTVVSVISRRPVLKEVPLYLWPLLALLVQVGSIWYIRS
ncbi:hypothetical protein [Nocardia sp. NPDC057668]|uniref:hypothetical protein n=1 Tax=Nocardia sp. NPDC057668 TaxID=3346202 RepID=UPI00366F87E0